MAEQIGNYDAVVKLQFDGSLSPVISSFMPLLPSNSARQWNLFNKIPCFELL